MTSNSRPRTITILGDSIPYEYSALLEKYLNNKERNQSYVIDTRALPGITCRNLIEQELHKTERTSDITLIHIGTNDWRQKTPLTMFEHGIRTLAIEAQFQSKRVLIASIIPDFNGRQFCLSQKYRGTSGIIREYNKVLKKICFEQRIRYIDIYNLWLTDIPAIYHGLKDAIHPNAIGQELIIKGLEYFILRENLTVVWPFSGKYANCNYKCPYCYVPTSVNTDRTIYHTIPEWEDAFIKAFGTRQKITFYLSYGEPSIAPQFMELLEMAGRHSNWEVMVTSNLSTDVGRLQNLKLVKDGRLNINASFHPTETTIDKFIVKLDSLRRLGIECPVVYVMYPGLNLENFETYFNIFRQNGYLVHIRRFRGDYKGKKYPEAYTPEQTERFIKYMDKASITYMLANKSSLGHLTFLGMHHILVDTDGTLELCDEYPGDKDLGNIFKNTAWLYSYPKPFPGPVSLGAVDDIANMVEVGYRELTGNHVASFAAQGGVYKSSAIETIYQYEQFDFSDGKAVADEFKIKTQTQPFDSRLKWFIRHRLLYYAFERNYLRMRQFLHGKYNLLKRADYRNLFSFHG